MSEQRSKYMQVDWGSFRLALDGITAAEALTVLYKAAATNTNIDDVLPLVEAKHTLERALGIEEGKMRTLAPNALYAEIDRLKAENERLEKRLLEIRGEVADLLAHADADAFAMGVLVQERDKAIAEAVELRRVVRAIQDDWCGCIMPPEFCKKYGLSIEAKDRDIDNWLLTQMTVVLASTALAAKHMARDEAMRTALREIRDMVDDEIGLAHLRAYDMRMIAGRALGETK